MIRSYSFTLRLLFSPFNPKFNFNLIYICFCGKMLHRPLLMVRKFRYIQNVSIISRNFHVAIIGSGPSAFYTAKYILDHSASEQTDVKFKINVDILESLPSPFGLVRYGVAPDHPEVKSVYTQFHDLMEKHRDKLRYIGNIDVGKDIDIQSLKTVFDAIIVATGAQSDMRLNIKNLSTNSNINDYNENNNIFSARQFVNWYNGHPSFSDLFQSHNTMVAHTKPIEHVVIVGQGNVALDCARILACDNTLLETTDISNIAFRTLFPSEDDSQSHISKSNTKVNFNVNIDFRQIKTITLLGRRGPLEIACTIKELRELTTLSNHVTTANNNDTNQQHKQDRNVNVVIDSNLIQEINAHLTPQQQNDLMKNRPKKRIFELIQKISQTNHNTNTESTSKTSKQLSTRTIKFQFFRSPKGFQVDPITNKITHLKVEINHNVISSVNQMISNSTNISLANQDDGNSFIQNNVKGSGVYELLPCDLLLTSIGYRSIPIPGIPFNSKTDTFPHENGRILDQINGKIVPGLYVTGWAKRGPTGIIGSNISDAKETATAVCADLKHLNDIKENILNTNNKIDPLQYIKSKISNKYLINWDEYLKIDQEEIKRGKMYQPIKCRDKILNIQEMIDIATK